MPEGPRRDGGAIRRSSARAARRSRRSRRAVDRRAGSRAEIGRVAVRYRIPPQIVLARGQPAGGAAAHRPDRGRCVRPAPAARRRHLTRAARARRRGAAATASRCCPLWCRLPVRASRCSAWPGRCAGPAIDAGSRPRAAAVAAAQRHHRDGPRAVGARRPAPRRPGVGPRPRRRVAGRAGRQVARGPAARASLQDGLDGFLQRATATAPSRRSTSACRAGPTTRPTCSA